VYQLLNSAHYYAGLVVYLAMTVLSVSLVSVDVDLVLQGSEKNAILNEETYSGPSFPFSVFQPLYNNDCDEVTRLMILLII